MDTKPSIEGLLDFPIEALLQIIGSRHVPLRFVFYREEYWIGSIYIQNGKITRSICSESLLNDADALNWILMACMEFDDISFKGFVTNGPIGDCCLDLTSMLIKHNPEKKITFDFNSLKKPLLSLSFKAANEFFHGSTKRAEIILEEAIALLPGDSRVPRNLAYIRSVKQPMITRLYEALS